MILPAGGSKQLKLTPPPAKPQWQAGKPSPVGLQLIGNGDVHQSAFRLSESKELKLVAYNFGDKPARGKLIIQGASGNVSEIEIAPGAREERVITADGVGNVTVSLDLGDAANPIVSARVIK